MISSSKSVLFGIAVLLGSCGGGDSDVDAIDPGQSLDDPVEFTAPSDATSLRTALITGTSAIDDDEFWQCSIENNDLMLAYRLFADGSGTETDLANPGVADQFTWQTTSATTMTTTLSSGAENNFTQIQFAGRNSMDLVFTESISLSCDRQATQPGTPVEPGVSVGPNALSYGGVIYPLTHGFEEVFFFSPEQFDSTHKSGPWQLADAEFQSSTIDGELTGLLFFWEPVGASVRLQATLRSPGGDGFNSATFNFAPDSLESNDPSFEGRFVFQDGFVGVDLNEDGLISGDDNEVHDITGGTISVERLGGTSAEMSFNLMLENDVSVVGSFQGDFPVFEHF